MITNSNHVIGIHGAPRSGTSWLGQLFNSSSKVAYRYQPFFSYAFRGRINSDSSESQIRSCMQDLLHSTDDFLNQRSSARLARELPDFRKANQTHLVYKEVRFHNLARRILQALPEAKIVGIVRDPRDVLASWFNAPREFSPEWSIADEWRSGAQKNAGLDENWYGYERWKQLAIELLELSTQYPDRCMLIEYSDLLANPRDLIGALFDFTGIRMEQQTLDFIFASSTRDDDDPYGVFRNHNREGRLEIPAYISAEIESDLNGTTLQRFLRMRNV